MVLVIIVYMKEHYCHVPVFRVLPVTGSLAALPAALVAVTVIV